MCPLYFKEGGIRIYGWEILLSNKIFHPAGPPPSSKGGTLNLYLFMLNYVSHIFPHFPIILYRIREYPNC